MQSNGARALLVLAALVVVVIGFVALQGEDEAGVGSADPPTTTTATDDTTAATQDDVEPKPKPEPEVTTVVVKGGEPEGGVAELEYDAGDQIRFAVESDTPDEIHVHGYDLYADVAPGKPAELDFPADLDGIYEVEFHDAGTQVAELVVNP